MTIPILNSCVSYTAGGAGSAFFTSKQVLITDLNYTGNTRDITITSVNSANTAITVENLAAGGSNQNRACVDVELTSPTNIRLRKASTLAAGGGTLVIVNVFEIDPSFIVSNQFLSVSLPSAPERTHDFTITAVDVSKSIFLSHGISSNSNSNSDNGGSVVGGEFTSTTNLRAHFTNSTLGSYDYILRGQVIEFI